MIRYLGRKGTYIFKVKSYSKLTNSTDCFTEKSIMLIPTSFIWDAFVPGTFPFLWELWNWNQPHIINPWQTSVPSDHQWRYRTCMSKEWGWCRRVRVTVKSFKTSLNERYLLLQGLIVVLTIMCVVLHSFRCIELLPRQLKECRLYPYTN